MTRQDPQPEPGPPRHGALHDQEAAQPPPKAEEIEEAKPSDTPAEYRTWNTGP